jgi:hypothetical protein
VSALHRAFKRQAGHVGLPTPCAAAAPTARNRRADLTEGGQPTINVPYFHRMMRHGLEPQNMHADIKILAARRAETLEELDRLRVAL